MSIRPVDMQVAIQRSDQYIKELNRDGQIVNNQFGIAVETQKMALQSQREVSSPKHLNITLLKGMMPIRQIQEYSCKNRKEQLVTEIKRIVY